MKDHIKHLSLILLVSSALGLSACQQKTDTQNTQQASEPSLEQQGIKEFKATPDDAKDIATLEQFNKNFLETSNDMLNELQLLKKQGKLTDQFVLQRKHDQVLSALHMLKDLELKTAQGHYIQGMLYDYWDQQLKFLDHANQASELNEKVIEPNKHIMVQAQNQLSYWQGQVQPKP